MKLSRFVPPARSVVSLQELAQLARHKVKDRTKDMTGLRRCNKTKPMSGKHCSNPAFLSSLTQGIMRGLQGNNLQWCLSLMKRQCHNLPHQAVSPFTTI